MRITLSVIKADIGSIGGHLLPSKALIASVEDFIRTNAEGMLIDTFVAHTGDDIAILATHTRGTGNHEVHKLAWDAFVAGTNCAKKQGLYGAGQDLLKDSFSGNVRGMGPAVAEMEIEERPAEPFVMFAADKTDPGAYNLPLYLSFCDPMYCPGLMLSPGMAKGFRFSIMDVNYTKGDRMIELNAPEDLYDIAALLRDNERFVVESIHSRETGEIAVAVSTTRLRNIAGKYTGKDDPVMVCRVQGAFPATGEVLAPYNIGPLCRGLHARQPHRPADAGKAELRRLLLRRSAGGLGAVLLRPQRHADRAGGRLRPSLLGSCARARLAEGDRDSPSRLLGHRHAALLGTGVWRHRAEAHRARVPIPYPDSG